MDPMGPSGETILDYSVFDAVRAGFGKVVCIIKPEMDRRKGNRLWKLLLFNTAVVLMYWLLMAVFGMDALAAEFREMGALLLTLTLALGNVTFFLIDRILSRIISRKNRGGG